MPAYLKVIDKFPADYTFCRFWGLSNELPNPASGSQQPDPKINISFNSFYASFQVKMGHQDLICLWESLQTMSFN